MAIPVIFPTDIPGSADDLLSHNERIARPPASRQVDVRRTLQSLYAELLSETCNELVVKVGCGKDHVGREAINHADR